MTILKHLAGMFSSKRSNTPPSLDAVLATFDQELENFTTLIPPAKESKPRTKFDSPHVQVNKMEMIGPKRMPQALPVMLPLMFNMWRGSKFYDGTYQPKSSTATTEFITELEVLAYANGAKDIRYVKVPNNAIFQGKGLPYQYAAIFTVEMDKDEMATAPSFEAFLEVAKGYKRMAVIANKLTRFMRRASFAAYPGTALGGITDYTHLGELAGLGAIGYHGMLITSEEGTRVRINTVYTNIENLPIENENEHLWIRDFCAMCKKCIRDCPVNAIYEEPVLRGDGGMQCIDHDDCRDYFNETLGCAICLAMCPFSMAGYDAIQTSFKGNPDAPQFSIPLEMIEP